MDKSCALCGVVLSSEAGDKWLGEFRAVYTKDDDWDSIRLSGVGTFADIDPWIPEDEQDRYGDPDLSEDATLDIAVNPLSLKHVIKPMPQFGPPSSWGYGFHSACWNLLTALFQPDPTDLFYICLSLRMDLDGILDWGHEYGGAAYVDHRRWGLPELHRSPLSFSHPVGLACDPFSIPAIQSSLNAPASHENYTGKALSVPDTIKVDRDGFKRLPPEILQDIIVRLYSRDVARLRQASPVFANLHLTESFWSSRFQRGHEFHHVFEACRTRPRSWKGLYFSIKSLVPVTPALLNRNRVWNLALRLEGLTAQVSGIPCRGCPVQSYYEPGEAVDKLEWHTASRGIRGPTASFSAGCRPLRTRTVAFETALKIRDLWVSFVKMNGDSFVSGLRFVGEDGHDISLGYIHAGTEVKIQFPDDRESDPYFISGWRLAIDRSGFRAVAVVTDEGTISLWAGEAEQSPKWCLAGPGEIISAVKAEFDAFKLVSLSRSLTPNASGDQGLSWRNNCLWSPDIPPDHVHFNGTYDGFPSKAFQNLPVPLSTVMIGGPFGDDLSQLIKIVVHIFDVDKFMGFEFFYTDPSKNQSIGILGPYQGGMARTNARSDDFKLSMAIEGPAGERIQGVEVTTKRGSISGLKIRTNRDREMLFPPPPDLQEEDFAAIQPSGSIIIGFCAVDFPLQDLGLMSINSPGDARTR